MRKLKTLVMIGAVMFLAFVMSGCSEQADVASRNLSQAADQFEIMRRVVFYNAITDTYMLQVEGLCSINVDNADNQLELTCKTGSNEFKKHYLGLSDNTTYFAEQIGGVDVDVYHYRVIFRPETILPAMELDTSGQ